MEVDEEDECVGDEGEERGGEGGGRRSGIFNAVTYGGARSVICVNGGASIWLFLDSMLI
jgi:hypothetical protein